MTAHGTDPRTYLPPHTSQLATKLSADGIDDCLVASILALVNGASLGEATRTPAGHEPSTAALVRTAVRMRNKLDDPDTAAREQQHGPLPASAAGRMVGLMWPAYPTLRTDDLDFKALIALLLDDHIAVLAGNPSHIQGPSPLKRVGDVGHAIALLRARERRDNLEILVDDPFRPGGKHLRGEWMPARHVRGFAFEDRDDTLTAVWVERYGVWTAERLMARQKDRHIDRLEEAAAAAAKEAERTEQRLRVRIRELESGSPVDCGPVIAEALDAERVAIRDFVEAREDMSVVGDLLAWLQGGMQDLGEAVALRIREEPVLTVSLFRAAVTMLVGFGLGWSGEQVALMVAFIEAVTAWLARRQVTPMADPSLPEGQPIRLPDGTAATVVRA